jgi:hypothetical protein
MSARSRSPGMSAGLHFILRRDRWMVRLDGWSYLSHGLAVNAAAAAAAHAPHTGRGDALFLQRPFRRDNCQPSPVSGDCRGCDDA